MKQFEIMGWIRQGFLGLIVCAVVSPSHAMSVRERYLLQHPQAVHQDSASPKFAKVVNHSKKHHAVKKSTPARNKTAHLRHTKIVHPAAKHARLHTNKSRHQRVIVAKHTHSHSKSKFDKRQARDARGALNHRRVKAKHAPIAKHHVRKSSAKHVTHHVSKHVQKHHRKHHRAG